ncbi:MAG: C39 family peptidase [Candidatus Moranbacteria bacterium]|nr:C39 family peptidase [Candidatus Moranbacteria bacterium]
MINTKYKIQNTRYWRYYTTTFAYVFCIMIVGGYLIKQASAQSTPSSSGATTPSTTNAADQQQIQSKQQQIQDLEQKAENYRQMIELNQNKAQTLGNQIKLMEGQIFSLERDVADIQQKIDSTEQDIGSLSGQIETKKKDIEGQKIVLGQLLQVYYENDQDTLPEMLLKNSSFSEFMNQTEYISQTGSKVDEVLSSITDAKNILEGAKKQLEAKNEQQKEQRGNISQKKMALDGEQSSKEQLLADTNGEEQKYQQLLARVEQQKQGLLGDIDELSQQKSSDLAAVEATLKKPKSGLASTSWYFNQRDSRWGDQGIGYSNTLMKSYGCAVTAVAMVFNYHGANINPGTLAKQPIFSHDLIVWPKSWNGINLVSSNAHGNIDWNVVDTEIKNKNPVIVFVRSTKRGAGHYVVIHDKDKSGDYVVHDPYWGANIFLSSTKAYVGALYGSGVVVDQMIIYH